jgi:signal transduction histidine kinase
MTPQMQQRLLDLSIFFDPSPSIVFRRILQAIIDTFGDTMAMVNLLDGDVVRFREVMNPRPGVVEKGFLALRRTYCQFSIGPVCPLLIQNAAEHPQFRDHVGVRLGITRYLGVPIHDPDGASIGTLCFLDGHSERLLSEDDVQFMSLLAMRVSAEVERERSIESRLAEHRELNQRLAEANQGLQTAAEEKRRFVATVIHDLRQPLTAARTAAHLLRDEDCPEEQDACLDLLEDRLRALGGLVEELARYSEIEAGRLPWRPERVELRALLTRCLTGARLLVPERDDHVRLVDAIDSDLGCADVDPDQLGHIVNNLLSNALKFTPMGTVTLRAHSVDTEQWCLEVVDTGIGIASEHRERIFDEFYQVPVAQRPDRRGLGLGLSIVRHLCIAAGAHLSVASEPGRGARFTVRFPRHTSLESRPAEAGIDQRCQ